MDRSYSIALVLEYSHILIWYFSFYVFPIILFNLCAPPNNLFGENIMFGIQESTLNWILVPVMVYSGTKYAAFLILLPRLRA